MQRKQQLQHEKMKQQQHHQPTELSCASGDSLPGCVCWAAASPISPALGAPKGTPTGAPSVWGPPTSNAFAFVGEDLLANEVEDLDTPQFIREVHTSSGTISAPSPSFPVILSCCIAAPRAATAAAAAAAVAPAFALA